jgi:hypothetical protein
VVMRRLHCREGRSIILAMIFCDPIYSFQSNCFFVPKLQLFFLCLRSRAAYIFWFFRTLRWLKCKLVINGGDEMLALLGREINKFSNDILGSYIFISIKLFFIPKLQLFFLCLCSPATFFFLVL